VDDLNFNERRSTHPINKQKSPNRVPPTRTPQPGRVSTENAWANANRAWTIACRLAAARR